MTVARKNVSGKPPSSDCCNVSHPAAGSDVLPEIGCCHGAVSRSSWAPVPRAVRATQGYRHPLRSCNTITPPQEASSSSIELNDVHRCRDDDHVRLLTNLWSMSCVVVHGRSPRWSRSRCRVHIHECKFRDLCEAFAVGSASQLVMTCHGVLVHAMASATKHTCTRMHDSRSRVVRILQTSLSIWQGLGLTIDTMMVHTRIGRPARAGCKA
jgi:hypothetical protein